MIYILFKALFILICVFFHIREGQMFNGKLLNINATLKSNLFDSGCFSSYSSSLFESRLEGNLHVTMKDLYKHNIGVVLNTLMTIVPYKSSVFKRITLNVFLLDMLTSYKG